jgi:ribosomal protein S4E
MSERTRPGDEVQNGDRCTVMVGRHAGKSGIVQDRNLSKSGHVSISVCQDDGVRFKTLAKSVVVQKGDAA